MRQNGVGLGPLAGDSGLRANVWIPASARRTRGTLIGILVGDQRRWADIRVGSIARFTQEGMLIPAHDLLHGRIRHRR